MYPKFADSAEKEGFKNIAFVWRFIAKAEKWHYERYISLAENVAKGTVFKRSSKVKWRCSNCGYIHEGVSAPDQCPACAHPQAYFMIHYTEY